MAILKGSKTEIDTKIEVYGDDNPDGAVVFMATFRNLKQSDVREWLNAIGEVVERPWLMDKTVWLSKYLIGWKGFPAKTEEGDDVELEFNEENVALVLDDPDYVNALYAAFTSVANGTAKAKN